MAEPGLQELFARLNGQSAANGGAANHTSYQQPAVSSPIFSPTPTGPQPHHQSAVISPNISTSNTPGLEANSGQQSQQQQQSAQLLNLLRFNSQPGISQGNRRPSHLSQATDASSVAHGRTTSASDLVASFARPSPQAPFHSSASATPIPAGRAEPASVSSENPQELLLRLLNHPKPAQSDAHSSRASYASPPPSKLPEPDSDVSLPGIATVGQPEKVPSDPLAARAATESPMRIFGSDGTGQSSHFQPETASATKPPKFTYVNPFEKLEAASPRNRTPAPEAAMSSMHTSASSHKIEILKPKGRVTSPVPAQHETVAEAVSDLGQQVDQQVEEALAEAESHVETAAAEEAAHFSTQEVQEIQQAVVDTAVEIKKELENPSTAEALREDLPTPLVEALKEVASEVAGGDIAESWESAEAEDSLAKDAAKTDIARLKKEFDQIDRSLVSASKNFIVYALVKKGGFKIIRQENGNHRQVFENHAERIFNIALCTAGYDIQESIESILGIGVNGSVFWTSLDAAREDQFGDDLDTQGIVLPPSPSQDDNTSGGQLKTRAKPSSRHPEFFAVGRGKSIHIIWPKVAAEYLRGKSRICHTEKYLKERSLKILTGKAGKDFTFSEDDTVIVSLDKAGRMRFWDIRKLTDPELGLSRNPPKQVEVSDTLLEFHTTSPTAKSWPTSVFFFDKDKPFNKGIALRYVMVGMKQNHSFQLWDLGLGKAVQEINLPHEKESDAICSVSFHPKTGIMAVAHPTRNSIFFIHVSCPRYNLPVFSQAAYISRLAARSDRSQLPPVNATAIMTSITEYSFASKGQIRSLHMLNEPAGPPDVDDPENTALFELYIMHSKGVCTVRIRRSDLGWKKEGEPLHPKEAEEEGIISIAQLKTPQPIPDESSTGGDTPIPKSASDRSVRESGKKESSAVSRQSMTPEAAMRASTLAKVESKQDAARAAIINGGDKSEKKKKKRSTTETASQTSSAPRIPPPSYAQAAQAPTPRSKSPSPPEPVAEAAPPKLSSETDAPAWAKSLISQHFAQSNPAAATAPVEFDSQKLGEVVQAEVSKGLSRELDVLYKRFDEAQRTMNAANGAKQESILRLVSSTLTENVDTAIRKMVDESVRNVLLPQLVGSTTSTLEKTIGTGLKKELPNSVGQALKHPQIFQSLPEMVAKKVAGAIEPVVIASVGSIVNPAISGLSGSIDRRIGDTLREAQLQRQADAGKISQLTDTVRMLNETIQSMATTQAELQGQLGKIYQHLSQDSEHIAGEDEPSIARSVVSSPAKPKKTPEQAETEEIAKLLAEGRFEEGTMKWLQSPRTVELYDAVLVHCNPQYLNQVTPLLALSTGAVVTNGLENHLPERLVWLDTALNSINPYDAEIIDVVPHIMDVMKDRLTAAYMSLNESSPGNPLLRTVSSMVSRVNEMGRNVSSYPREKY